MPQHDHNRSQAHSHSHVGMMALCVVLMGGAFLYFSGASPDAGLSLGLLLPLLVCVGAHFLMHRFMGHGEQHSDSAKDHDAQERPLKSKPHQQITPPRITSAN